MSIPFLVKDIFEGSEQSFPNKLTALGNTLFFSADEGVNGSELWKSDGTEAGTVLVKDIRPGINPNASEPFGSSLDRLTAVGNTLFFTANDSVNGTELWRSDGTEAGTVLVKDIRPGSSYGYPNDSFINALTAVGNTLFFRANDGVNGEELWRSDGTEAGTVLVKDIRPGSSYGSPNNSSPSALTAVGNTLFFAANDGVNGEELWRSDGTEAGTVLVKDIRPGSSYGSPASSSPRDLTAVGNTLFFRASDGVNGEELWRSDGTEAGTVLVKDIRPGSSGSSSRYLTAVGNTLFFRADDNVNGSELWRSDGTEAGTVLVKDIRPGSSGSSLRYFAAVGNTLFFIADDGVNGSELWRSDGTEAGTVLVKDIRPGSSGSFPRYFTALGNTLFFRADDGVNGTELWQSDGTEAGTFLVQDIRPGSSYGSPVGSFPGNLTVAGNTLFFRANDGVNNSELWALELPAVIVSAELIQVAEGGATTTYSVVLNSAPGADVTITLNPGNQLSLDQTTLTFTPANFDVPQTVTVTAIDDTIGEGPHRGVISATVSSADLNYDGITVANVVAQITDNDIPQQDPTFQPATTNPFGLTNVGNQAAPTFVDIDGDGDLDAFVGEFFGNTLFFENTGTASSPAFAAPVTNPFGLTDVGSSAAPTFVDIDGDGDLDAFIGNNYGNTLFYRNTGSAGSPAFAAPTENPFGLTNVGSFAAPTFADIDGDGDLDAFIGERFGNTLFYRNTGSAGSPAFAAPTLNPFGLTNVGNFAAPTFADIDGDGDLDAFVGERDGNTLFYRNTGSASAPAFAAPTENPFGLTNVGNFATPTFADIDGDGDLDAFIGNGAGNTLFFLNEPGVTLSAELIQVAEGGMMATYTVVLDSAPGADVTITLNPGNQLTVDQTVLTFTPANFDVAQTVTVTAINDPIGEGPHRGVISATVSSADFNYNGITVANVVAQIADNDIPAGPPVFQDPEINPFGLTNAGSFAAPTFADIDGDGDLDAFVGNNDGDTLFFENTGSADAPAFSAPVTNPFGLANVGFFAAPTFADIDGDGDLDAFIGEIFGDTFFFENTGSASSPSFSAAQTNAFGLTNVGYSAAPTFADIDGDGDLDAFIGDQYGDTQFFENTGTVFGPAFAPAAVNPFGLDNVGSYAKPTFADIDGDGDLDAFIGAASGTTRFFANTGSASSPAFAPALRNPFGFSNAGSYAAPTFADIDGDGDLDAFVGNQYGEILFFLNADLPTNGPDVIFSDTLLQATEGGVTATFSLVLDTAPTSNVTVTLNPGNQLSANITSLVFTPGNFNIAQTVTVTAVDDPVGEGPHRGAITATVTSADPNYNGLAVAPVVVQITDNDVPAGPPTFQLPQTNPFGLANQGENDTTPVLVDIDGDGDLDLFSGNEYNSDLLFYENVGTAGAPNFTAPVANPFGLNGSGANGSPAFADIDGDGDLDAFIGDGGGDIQFFRNTGSATAPAFGPRFENPFGLADVGTSAQPVFVDLDDDGDLDAIVGESNGDINFFENLGSVRSPAFADRIENPFGLENVGEDAAPELVDFDGDGDLDAFVGNDAGDILLFANTGTASAPAFASPVTNPFGLQNLGSDSAPALADLDGDGDFDVLTGNEAGDFVFFLNEAAPPPNVINGTPGNDRLRGTANADQIQGLEGNDQISGLGGNDTLLGGAGKDRLSGGAGDDFIDGGAGTDTLISRGNGNFVATQTTLTGPEGVDAFVNIEAMELTGGVGNNTLDGSALTTIRARFTGGAGNDILLGGQAQDTLQGQAGNDFLSGGLGKDTLTGGNDNDTFDYRNLGDSLLSGFDVITDFNAAEDKLRVSQLPTLFTANAGSVSKLNASQIQGILTPAVLANPGDSAVFNLGNRVFVAINDGTAGYQAGSDALIELAISGLSGSLTAGNFFTLI